MPHSKITIIHEISESSVQGDVISYSGTQIICECSFQNQGPEDIASVNIKMVFPHFPQVSAWSAVSL